MAGILVFELACFESVELRGVCFSFDTWVTLLFLSFTKSRGVCFSFDTWVTLLFLSFTSLSFFFFVSWSVALSFLFAFSWYNSS